jgi:hypothetical protein
MTINHPRIARAKHSGQAMTEFLVVALAMLPLFLLMPVIAKYQDIAHETQMAARYVAFDGTIRGDKSEGTLADEVRRRFFSNSNASIKTNDVAGEFDAHRNLFWQGPDNKSLLASFSDVTVSFGPSHGATRGAGFESASDMTPFPVVAQQLGLGSKGIYTANVHVKLANLPSGLNFHEPFNAINISMVRSSSVLLNPWTAKDAGEAVGRIGSAPLVFPAGELAQMANLVSLDVTLVDYLGGVTGPKLGQLDFWKDVVPEDRLKSRQESGD